MTQRSSLPERLPTLTDVVEYEGEVMTVRSLVGGLLEGANPQPLGTAGEMAPDLGESSGAEVDARRFQQLLEAVRQAVGESLEERLREALAPLLEQAVQQAVRVARERVAEVVAEFGATVPSRASDQAPGPARGGISP